MVGNAGKDLRTASSRFRPFPGVSARFPLDCSAEGYLVVFKYFFVTESDEPPTFPPSRISAWSRLTQNDNEACQNEVNHRMRVVSDR